SAAAGLAENRVPPARTETANPPAIRSRFVRCMLISLSNPSAPRVVRHLVVNPSTPKTSSLTRCVPHNSRRWRRALPEPLFPTRRHLSTLRLNLLSASRRQPQRNRRLLGRVREAEDRSSAGRMVLKPRLTSGPVAPDRVPC